jgi:putative phosphoesterase
MQILVISDTHGRFDILRRVILSHETADLIVHCGDGEYETERLLDERPELKERIISVRGNCDHSPELPLLRVLLQPEPLLPVLHLRRVPRQQHHTAYYLRLHETACS